MDIGKRVAGIRAEVGLTQSGLARAVGISQSAISQIEAGERNPSFEMLLQIAKALDVSIPHLVGAEVEGLASNEVAHVRKYRGLSPKAKKELEEFAAYLRQKQAARRSAK